ncbi:MAG TPA: hypothetical protein VGN54_11820 [Mycobacteriales bacterium]|nr:hypothetical protein [Mycobacteriales bacterium]
MTAPPPDEGRPDEPLAWPDDLVVPDDISALAADIEALRRERAAARRRSLLQRALFTRRRRSYGLSAPMVIAVLLLIGTCGSLLVLLGPRRVNTDGPSALPLAHPAAAAGTVGGLLPDLVLHTPNGFSNPTPGLARPAALILIPPGCKCPDGVTHAVAAAATYTLHEFVVGSNDPDTRLYAEPHQRLVTGLVDDAGALLAAYGAGPGGPTVVVLGRDGVVTAVATAVGAATPLAQQLGTAVGPRRQLGTAVGPRRELGTAVGPRRLAAAVA